MQNFHPLCSTGKSGLLYCLSSATFHTYLLAFLIFIPWVMVLDICILSSALIKQVGESREPRILCLHLVRWRPQIMKIWILTVFISLRIGRGWLALGIFFVLGDCHQIYSLVANPEEFSIEKIVYTWCWGIESTVKQKSAIKNDLGSFHCGSAG